MQINARLHGCIHKACAAHGIHRHHTNDHPIRYNLHSFTECHSNSLFLVTCPYLARKLHKYRPSRGYTGIDNVYATYVSVLGTRSRHGGCHPKLTDLLKCFEIVLHSKASLTHTPHTDRKERYMVSIISGIASVFAAGTLLKRNFFTLPGMQCHHTSVRPIPTGFLLNHYHYDDNIS